MRALRTTRSRLAAVALALALATAGCGDDGGDGDGDAADAGSEGGGDGAATGPLFPDDFEPVCQGATVSAATAYDEAATTHKALYFATSEDTLADRSSDLPTDWTVLFSTEEDALAAVDLVLCAVRTSEELVKECTGYEDDGVDTGNTVNWFTATYDVSVRAATTGQVLAQEEMQATDKDCPTLVFFDEDGETVDMYASLPPDTVIEFLKPFVQP